VAAENGHGKIAKAILATVTEPRHELLVCIANAPLGGGSLQPLLDRIAELPPEIVREHMVPHYGGMDVDKAAARYGDAPLHYAAKGGHLDIIQALIAAGADVDKANKSGRTPLIWAAIANRCKIAQALIDAGAAVNKADAKGETPLMWAEKKGNRKVAEVLVAAATEPKKRHRKGEEIRDPQEPKRQRF
jgi:ankyrin repeat protein